MRSSTFLTILGAGLAIASPIVRKALYTEVVTDVVYVYVTETEATSTPPAATMVVTLEVIPTQASFDTTTSSSASSTTTTSTSSTPTTTSTPPPPPPPTTEAPAPATTSTPPPAAPTTEAPAPAATTEAPAVVASAAPSPSPVEAVAGDAGLPTGTDFQSTVIYHHNIHRRNHSAPDTTYDSTMASYAMQVASSCHYAHDLTPGGGGYGQNIAAYGATDVSSVDASMSAAMAITNMWYNGEVNTYLPSYYGQASPDMSNFEAWGHFSQVVWAGSKGVGCASVLCGPGKIFDGLSTWFTVCNYLSAGNMGGAYGANVLPSLGRETKTV